MRFPGVARAGTHDPRLRGQPVRPEALADDLARRGRRALRQRRAVGAHVGDEPRRPAVEDDALVERLGEAHGPSHPEAEPARGFLLERRGGERRNRVAPDLAALERGDMEHPGTDALHRPSGGLRAAEAPAVDLLPVEPGEGAR